MIHAMVARSAPPATASSRQTLGRTLVLLLTVSAFFTGRTVFAFSFHVSPHVSHRTTATRRLHLGDPSPLRLTNRPPVITTGATCRRQAYSQTHARPSKHTSKHLDEHPIAHVPSEVDDTLPHRTTLSDVILISASTLAMMCSVVTMFRFSGPGSWRYYVAGAICAATSHSLTTPIDVVKTRKQVDSTLWELTTPEAAMKIIKEEGAATLLAGLGPTTVGYLMEGAVKFGVYEVLKPVVRRFLKDAAAVTSMAALDSQLLGFILCGTASGIAASLMLCPMEALRIRLVAEPDFAPKGWIQGGYKMLRNEGVVGLWKGMTPMLYKQVPYTITKNVSFDFLTRGFYSILRNAGRTIGISTKVAVPLLAAMIASMLSAVSSQPGDVLLSLVNAHEGDKRTNSFLKEIWQSEDGLKGLFVGMKARFLHVGVIVTSQLLIYDVVKRLCGIAATGSV